MLRGRRPRRGDPDFDGAVVGLGALGAVTRVTLDVEPTYEVTQSVYEQLPWRAIDEHFEELSAAGDSVAIHFTWKPDQDAVERVLESVEDALEPFAPRPHWGKLFLTTPAAIAARYERLRDFAELLGRVDPRGAFRNDWLLRRVLG